MTQPSDVAAATTELWEIPPKLIEPNPRQPRTVFDEAALAELAASIKEHGLIQPLVVTPDGQPDHYVLIAGERRWRAAQLAGLDVVPCIVKTQIDARAQTELALVENVQRANLSAADEARAYEQLATEFGLSDEAIGARVGKSRSTIANLRRLLVLPPTVLAAIGDGDGQIPQGLARQLVPLAKIAPTAVEHAAERIIEHPDEIERIVNQTINDNAITIKYDWDTHWLTTPVKATDQAGEFEVGACHGCLSFLNVGKTPYCTDQRCYAAKSDLFAAQELKRVSHTTHIPIAAEGEKVEALVIDHHTSARAKAWLSAKTPPSHLRLISAIGQKVGTNWYHGGLVQSRVVLLASTDPGALTRQVERIAASPDETPAQKAKRIEHEEAALAERRAERALARKQKADVSWLGVHTAEILAPQLTISGSTLRYLCEFVSKRVRPNGHWIELEEALRVREQAIANAKSPKDLEALWREVLVLSLINEAVSAYDPRQIYDWDRAVKKITALCDQTELGLRLTKGWDQSPVHHTPGNCWVCGQFTANERLTKIDEEAGWRTATDGTVMCSTACGAKLKRTTPKSKAVKVAKQK